MKQETRMAHGDQELATVFQGRGEAFSRWARLTDAEEVHLVQSSARSAA